MSVQQQQQRGSSKSIGNYILGRTIGEGTFGKVKLGRHILSGATVAVKVLQKDRIVEVADVERVAREVHILKLIRHPHIVQLFEIIETRGQLYLIMQYASGGELFDHIVAKGRVPEPEACRFFHQIIAGVEKIHAMNVVHRDLKPENLLLDENQCVKIVDFGLSNLYREGQRLSTACGSPCYAPPEMVAGHQYVPQMCDLWSCGVILFALVCGFLPFEDQSTAALYKKILTADYSLPDFITDAVKDLIAGLLTVDPERRHTIPIVRQHPWYRQIVEASQQPPEPTAGSFDEDVLQELEGYGFPRAYAVRCLELNKHNHVTTTYWLLLERKRKVMNEFDKVVVDGSAEAVPSSTSVAEGQVIPAATAEPEHCTPARGNSMEHKAVASTPRRNQEAGHSARNEHSTTPTARTSPVPAWSPNSGGRSPVPTHSPVGSARTTGVSSAVAAAGRVATPRIASPGIGVARRDPKARSANAPSGPVTQRCVFDHGAVGMGSAVPGSGVAVQPVSSGRRNQASGVRSTTPPVTPRVQASKPAGASRTQPLSARAATPQGARTWRQPQPQSATQPAQHPQHVQPAQQVRSVAQTAPVAGSAVTPRSGIPGVMTTPRSRPPVPAAAQVGNVVRAVGGSLPQRTWR